MNNRSKLAVATGLGLTLTIALSACTPDSSSETPSSSETLTIALAAPLTGSSANSGEQMKNGCQLAVSEYNANRGDAPTVSLNTQDDASTPSTGVNLVALFQQDNALAIIGGYNSPVVLAMQEKVAAAEIPFLAQGVASSINSPWVYHSVPIGTVQAAGTVEYLKNKGAVRIGILTDTSAFGTSALPDIRKAITDAGLTVVGEAAFDVAASNMTPQVLQAVGSGVDGLILYTAGEPIARAMISIRQAGINVPVVSNFTAADPVVAKVAGSNANGLVFESIVDPNKKRVQESGKKYSAMFPGATEIPVFATVTYDQCAIALEGIKSGVRSGAQMKAFLDEFSSDSLASGAEGSVLKYTASDHTGWKASSLTYVIYADGKQLPCSDAQAKC